MPTLRTFINKHHLRIVSTLAETNPNMDGMPPGSNHFRCKLTGFGRQMTVPFSQGPAISGEPTVDGVLDCLLSDSYGADQTFEDWCGEYGYDADSRKAERTYKAVQEQTEKLRRFLGAKFSDALACERD